MAGSLFQVLAKVITSKPFLITADIAKYAVNNHVLPAVKDAMKQIEPKPEDIKNTADEFGDDDAIGGTPVPERDEDERPVENV